MSEPEEVESLEHILEHLRQTRGFDFTAYKRSTFFRDPEVWDVIVSDVLQPSR